MGLVEFPQVLNGLDENADVGDVIGPHVLSIENDVLGMEVVLVCVLERMEGIAA